MNPAHAAIATALQTTFASKVGSKTQMTKGEWDLMLNVYERNQQVDYAKQIGRASCRERVYVLV